MRRSVTSTRTARVLESSAPVRRRVAIAAFSSTSPGGWHDLGVEQAPQPTMQQMIEALEAMDPAEASALMPAPTDAELLAAFPELDGVDRRDVTVGEAPARLYRKGAEPAAAALVWAHGGGF